MKCKANIIAMYLFIVVALAAFLCGRCTNGCSNTSDTTRIDSVKTSDTVYVEVHDTLPAEKGKTIVKYIQIPAKTDTIYKEREDSITLAVVQKTFSDDSTYTAYVSGLEYDSYPTLDSISIKQKVITNTIVKTITIETEKKKSRWHFGLQGGYGFGFKSKTFEPYIGGGISYDF